MIQGNGYFCAFSMMCSKESVEILFDNLADLLASQIRKFEDFSKNLDGGF